MTGSEVRGMVQAYYNIRSSLDNPIPSALAAAFAATCLQIEQDCVVITDTSGPGRWARGIVGPVLAAAIGATVHMRKDVPSRMAALRVFGLFGSPNLNANHAWSIVKPYIHEPVVSAEAIATINQKSGLLLHLPPNPSPITVLQELTRERSGSFSTKVTSWIVDYFRVRHLKGHSLDKYGKLYASTLLGMFHISEVDTIRYLRQEGKIGAEDWEDLIAGRVPYAWAETHAGFTAARRFIADYWHQWHRPERENSCVAASNVV